MIKRIRIILFLLIAILLFAVVNFIAQPYWSSWNNYNTIHGFYEEPEDSIETIFLGSSQCLRAFDPMELYKDYGISSYNLGTEHQPMLASYYWLLEAYRFNENTLDTVILEAQKFTQTTGNSFYRKAIDGMRLSSVKYHAYKDYLAREDTESDSLISLLFPAFSYHERWKELTDVDFKKAHYSAQTYTRGYDYTMTQTVQTADSFSNIGVPTTILDEEAEPAEIQEESFYYFSEMVAFCKDKGINLIIVKTPRSGWSSAQHNTVQEIAEENDVEFIDLCFSPYLEELDYNIATDNADDHLNYFGSCKLTKFLGKHLIEEYGNKDIRNEEGNEHIESEMADYQRRIAKVRLDLITDPSEYLKDLIDAGNYTIMITVKDSASNGLTNEQREMFEQLGLVELSKIGHRESYIAVVSNGVIQVEQRSSSKELEYSGEIDKETSYVLTSAGYDNGNSSSCKINDKEYSKNSRGLNIIVYDNKLGMVIDQAAFDTHSGPEREVQNIELALQLSLENGDTYEQLTGNKKKLYLYDRYNENTVRTAWSKLFIDDDEMLSYLDFYLKDKDYLILLSVKEEAAEGLPEKALRKLASMGFRELSGIEYGDSYLALVSEGKVVYEEDDHGKAPITYKQFGIEISSGGEDSGDVSSIRIMDNEYSKDSRGVNIVIYDTITNRMVDSRVFDTHEIVQQLPD